MKRVALFVCIVILSSAFPLLQARQTTLPQPSEFSYRGLIGIDMLGAESWYDQGLAYRYVNSELRFLTLQKNGHLVEFAITGKTYGDTVSTKTNDWDLSQPSLLHDFNGIWWNEALQQLWVNSAVDYTTTVNPVFIYTMTLNANGTISNLHGPIGLQGINAKRAFGGFGATPPSLASVGVPPYLVHGGGYTSLLCQGGGASMGLDLYAIPDPAGFANGSEIPSSQFKVLSDHFGCVGDWYAAGAPSTYDRTRRVTRPINYYDGGDPRQNPNTAPTDPPAPGAQWLSPAPDGYGREIWGDGRYGTWMWFAEGAKQGFMELLSVGMGVCFYGGSTLNSQYRSIEHHIYDPATFAAVAQGTLLPARTQPASMLELHVPGFGIAEGNSGNTPHGNVTGAVYDATSHRMFALTGQTSNAWLLVYDYTGSTPPPPSTATLSVSVTGTGSVVSAPAGISCPPTCAASFPIAAVISLTATPGANSAFSGWGPPCSGAAVCTLTLNASATVTATFVASVPPPNPVYVQALPNACKIHVGPVPPPDTSGGWRVQFRCGATSIGNTDSSAPYEKSSTIAPAQCDVTGTWTKSGAATIIQPLGTMTAACTVK